MDIPDLIARRELLKTAGLAAAGATFFPVGLLRGLAADEAKPSSGSTKETLDTLLKKNREQNGGGNHTPMALIALYRMGGTPQQMRRYVANFQYTPKPKSGGNPKGNSITAENWRNHLGGRYDVFSRYLAFFCDRAQQASVETVLKETVPTLLKGPAAMAYHSLIRLGYAIDYGDREEILFSLAEWAMDHMPNPEFDAAAPSVEPDALFSEIIKNSTAIQIKPVGSIMGRMTQVYASRDFRGLLKPIRIPGANPLARISELILEIFTKTHDFTLLHALTSCHAVRLVLPYVADPFRGECLTAYWHSVCASYLTVSRIRPEIGKDSVAGVNPGWDEILSKAAAIERAELRDTEHAIKLAYSCWSESRHYKRDGYLALASREIQKPSSVA